MQCFILNSLNILAVPVPANKAVAAKQEMYPQHADTSRKSGVWWDGDVVAIGLYFRWFDLSNVAPNILVCIYLHYIYYIYLYLIIYCQSG